MNAKHRTVLKESLKGRGFCKDLGVGARMYHSLTDNSRGGFDPLEKILKLIDHSKNDIIIDYICSENDGVFVKNIESDASTKSIFQEQSDILSECSDVIRVLTDSCADGKITTKEIETLKTEVDQFVRRFYSFTKAVESGRHS